jgi:hypothetical protein
VLDTASYGRLRDAVGKAAAKGTHSDGAGIAPAGRIGVEAAVEGMGASRRVGRVRVDLPNGAKVMATGVAPAMMTFAAAMIPVLSLHGVIGWMQNVFG